jgi:hypothetical protein
MNNNQEIINKLNEKKHITPLEPMTYSSIINNIDYQKKNKVKSEYSFIDLESLVNNFKLDYSFSIQQFPEPDVCEIGSLPKKVINETGFISKKFYSDSYSYSYPPEGPIPGCFRCNVCGNIGPNYHSTNCSDPFDYSLYLTEKGAGLLSRKYKKFPEEYSFIRDIINNDVVEPNTSYIELVRKRGQKKVHKDSSKYKKFKNNLELKYQDSEKRQTIIRISKNGSINIISAHYSNNKLPDLIINKINEASSLILDNFQKVYPEKDKLFINNNISYKYLVQGQFHLIPESLKEKVNINLGNIYELLKNEESISHLDYNNGDRTSKSGKQTNPILQFNILSENSEISEYSEYSEYKISVAFYKKGAVQLRGSSDNENKKLDFSVLEKGYSRLVSLIKNIPNTPGIYSPDYSYKESTNEFNTVDSSKPKECRIENRPVPYTFNGKCKEGYYSAPWGKRRRVDSLYEPCCYKITNSGESSMKNIKKMVIEGFPDAKQAKKYSIDNPDTKSAVYYPGTKVLYQRRFKGLKDLTFNEINNIKNKNSFGNNKNKNNKNKNNKNNKNKNNGNNTIQDLISFLEYLTLLIIG